MYKIKNKIKKQKSTYIVERMAKYEIGDGKIPNKYFVTISDDYQILHPKTNELKSVNEVFGIDGKYKTIKVFDTYKEAKNYAENIYTGTKIDGIEVNSIEIEDRLSGQLYINDKNNNKYENLNFTIDEEKKKGVKPTITEEDKW